jgi:hypothetical protein
MRFSIYTRFEVNSLKEEKDMMTSKTEDDSIYAKYEEAYRGASLEGIEELQNTLKFLHNMDQSSGHIQLSILPLQSKSLVERYSLVEPGIDGLQLSERGRYFLRKYTRKMAKEINKQKP